MKVYVTIKTDYFNDHNGPRTERYTLTQAWGEKTCLNGFFRDDFDWIQSEKNKKCWFGRNIYDRAITAIVFVYR